MSGVSESHVAFHLPSVPSIKKGRAGVDVVGVLNAGILLSCIASVLHLSSRFHRGLGCFIDLNRASRSNRGLGSHVCDTAV